MQEDCENEMLTLVSSMTAHKICTLCIAILRLFKVSWWYSCVPCEKLNLATFIPALRSFSSIGTDRDAGPSVQTIFVFGILPSFGISFRIPSISIFAIPQPKKTLISQEKNRKSSSSKAYIQNMNKSQQMLLNHEIWSSERAEKQDLSFETLDLTSKTADRCWNDAEASKTNKIEDFSKKTGEMRKRNRE